MENKVRGRIDAVLIAGGKYHDIDFARLELLQLLALDERVRVRVLADYEDVSALEGASFIVSYTCDVTPSAAAQAALRSFLGRGGRWYALHGTNSILRFLADGKVDSPRTAPDFMAMLGSMFIAHPPIGEYTVSVTDPSHPLVAGLEDFATVDELYLMETYGELQVLLHTRFAGEAGGFVEDRWPEARHPVFYLKEHGPGAVLYLTLGHCRGHYDLQPLMEYWPTVERCSWDLPVFRDLLIRGIDWAKEAAPLPRAAP